MERNLSYRVYNIMGGRLYTDRIHDTAILLDNKIIEGPSFQFRNNNNSPLACFTAKLFIFEKLNRSL